MKRILFLSIILLCGMSLHAQEGTVYDSKVMHSDILNGDRSYAIYLPADYNTSERSYPVLYLLHPAGPRGTVPNHQAWSNYGELKHFIDKAVACGEIGPMIVVMPDANYGSTRVSYFNDPDGNFNFEDFFFNEFIPYIESNYRCRTERDSRAIAGASMGGGASFFYALHHPEMFSMSCPLSAAARSFDESYVTSRYPGMDAGELEKWYAQYDVFELFRQYAASDGDKVKWFIACGDDDGLSDNSSLLHVELNELGVPHEFRISDGKHDWVYWRSILPEVLRFVSSGFVK